MRMHHRDQTISHVRANDPLCREHFRLVLHVDSFPATQPGQFIQIACRDLDLNYSPEVEVEWKAGQVLDPAGRELMGRLALLRRPFSLADRRDVDGGVELEIIHRVVGVGTDWLSQLRVGDRVNVLGPLGNSFTLPEREQTAVLVGGGVGIPPILYLARGLSGGAAVAFCGAVSRDLLPLTLVERVEDSGFRVQGSGVRVQGSGFGVQESEDEEVVPGMVVEEFGRWGIPSVITTDDGSFGYRGYVTQALERYLDSLNMEPRTTNPVIYTCGPEPMMKRVAEIALSRGLPCQVAVERAMACGMGTCQSCVIRVRDDEGSGFGVPVEGSGFGVQGSGRGGWGYRLACTDGPIFRGADLLW